MIRRWVPAALFVIVAACGGGGEDDQVLVFAAASLSDVFEDLAVAYEDANPGIDVEVNVAASSALRLQIDDGAPADVVAVANELVMTELAGEGHVESSTIFASNGLVVAAPADGAGRVVGPESLADEDLLVGVCAPQVPCGGYAIDALSSIGVEPSLDTEEPDVRSLTTKIATGELDAGVIYSTDAATRPDDIEVVATLDGADVVYPIAWLTDARHAEDAASFVEFVLSDDGLVLLADAGFGPP